MKSVSFSLFFLLIDTFHIIIIIKQSDDEYE